MESPIYATIKLVQNAKYKNKDTSIMVKKATYTIDVDDIDTCAVPNVHQIIDVTNQDELLATITVNENEKMYQIDPHHKRIPKEFIPKLLKFGNSLLSNKQLAESQQA